MFLKMWIITFALFTVYGVIYGDPDVCDTNRRQSCFVPPINAGFPENIEDLDKICPALITRFSCLSNYTNQCGAMQTGTIGDKVEQVYQLLYDACDKDSELHEELSIRLPCLSQVVMDHANACSPIIPKAVEMLQRRFPGSGKTKVPGERGMSLTYHCLHEAVEFSCIMAYTSVTCSDATKELVGRIVDRVGYADTWFCPRDIREEVNNLLPEMQLKMVEWFAIQNIISEE